MTQLELQLDQPRPAPLTLVGMVYEILRGGEWLTPYEIVRALQRKHNEWHSDSGVTARIRDLRKPRFGGFIIDKRLREGSRSFEYRLGG